MIELAAGADPVASDLPRVLIYTQDSFGLGHLRRATNLANELVARRQDVSVLLVVDSPVAPFFRLSPSIDFLKLPTVVKVGAGVFSPGRLQTSYEQVKALRSGLLREAVLQFAPHVLLVDHMPGGANRELMPALDAIRHRRLSTRLVLGLRDIIDEPSVTRSLWQREGVYQALRRNYQQVLIYGSPAVFATAEEYRLQDAMVERVQYCGYVCNMAAVDEPRHVREQLGIQAEKIVTVMVGGGADALRLLRTYLEALPLLGSGHSLATVMVSGPFFPEQELRTLRERASRLGIHLCSSLGDSLSQINAADVVVGMAGYNTLSEILRFGKRAVIVPRAGPSAEQGMRARLFAARGLIDVLEPAKLEARALATALEQALSASAEQRPRSCPALDGVANATSALLGALPQAPVAARESESRLAR